MIDFDAVKNNLSHQDIIDIIESFFPYSIEYHEFEDYMILPTICHNIDAEDASLKLYYYDNTHLFFCYTHCNESFDIYELVKKMLGLRDRDSSIDSILEVIQKVYKFNFTQEDITRYKSIAEKYERKNKRPPKKIYNERILNSFPQVYPIEWIRDGLTPESMRKYNIRFAFDKNQAVIPHYNINSELVGIRVRNFDEIPLSHGDKYMPAKISGEYYSHPLMYNLYGISQNKNAISKYKTAWVFEGEKSCIITDGWFKENNLAVASCGNKMNKFQMGILFSLGVKDIVICYDRMGATPSEEKAYFNKLYEMCKKYTAYANFSFIFDRKHVLPLKAAPVDMGREVFEKLFRERVIVR